MRTLDLRRDPGRHYPRQAQLARLQQALDMFSVDGDPAPRSTEATHPSLTGVSPVGGAVPPPPPPATFSP